MRIAGGIILFLAGIYLCCRAFWLLNQPGAAGFRYYVTAWLGVLGLFAGVTLTLAGLLSCDRPPLQTLPDPRPADTALACIPDSCYPEVRPPHSPKLP